MQMVTPGHTVAASPEAVIAVDTETHSIQPGLLAPPLVCGSFSSAGASCLRDRRDTATNLRILLEQGIHIIGANIAFDMAVCLVADPSLTPLVFEAYRAGQIHDVQIRQALNAIAEGHLYKHPDGGPLRDPETNKVTNRYSLSQCAFLCLGTKVQKADTWRLRYATLEGVPLKDWPQEARDYAINDAVMTRLVYEYQYRAGFRNLQDEAAQCRAAFALQLAAVWGLRTDAERVAAWSKNVTEDFLANQLRFLEAGLLRWQGTKKNPRKKIVANLAHIRELVTAAYQGSPPMTEGGKKGKPQVSYSTDTLENSGDEVLEGYAEAGENRTFHNTFLPTLKRGTVLPINTNWTPLVETGRVSSGDPNVMNLPRKGGVRECFRAREGCVYAFADYSAIELATLAQACLTLLHYSSMAEAINSGRDLHSAFAAQLCGKSYEVVKAAVKNSEEWADTLRQAAKAANFGFPGGMGVAKFVGAKRKEGLSICKSMGCPTACGLEKLRMWRGRECPPTCRTCLEYGTVLRDTWFSLWPEMKPYFAIISRETESGSGEIEQLVTGRVRGACSFTDGANTRFQGLAADGAKHALWRVTEECLTGNTALRGARPVLFVHDEIGIEVAEERAGDALERLEVVMVEAMREFVTDVKVSVEGALCRNWWKGAKALKVGDKVVPVKPGPNGKGWVHDIA